MAPHPGHSIEICLDHFYAAATGDAAAKVSHTIMRVTAGIESDDGAVPARRVFRSVGPGSEKINIRQGARMSKANESVNGRRGEHSQSTGLPLTPGQNRHRLEAPFYYAANVQILLSGHDAALLFTRPHPAILQDGNLASMPLREPVALIQMSLAGLKDLSRAAAEMIRQIEERTGEIQTEFTRPKDVVSDLILSKGEKS